MKSFLTLLWVIALFLAASYFASAQAATRFEIKQMIVEEATDSLVPVPLALAVAKVESDFNAKALSSAGARGVMQIMPQTAQGEFGVHPNQLWDAQTNIRLGVRFLERLHDQYDGRWDLALSHYNGGTIKGGRPHSYTVSYVAQVEKWQKIYQEQASLWEGGNIRTASLLRDDEDESANVELRQWRMREQGRDYVDYYREDDLVEEEVQPIETRIIIVERERPSEEGRYWRRPPPPPPPPFGRERGRRPPPRPYFH